MPGQLRESFEYHPMSSRSKYRLERLGSYISMFEYFFNGFDRKIMTNKKGRANFPFESQNELIIYDLDVVCKITYESLLEGVGN